MSSASPNIFPTVVLYLAASIGTILIISPSIENDHNPARLERFRSADNYTIYQTLSSSIAVCIFVFVDSLLYHYWQLGSLTSFDSQLSIYKRKNVISKKIENDVEQNNTSSSCCSLYCPKESLFADFEHKFTLFQWVPILISLIPSIVLFADEVHMYYSLARAILAIQWLWLWSTFFLFLNFNSLDVWTDSLVSYCSILFTLFYTLIEIHEVWPGSSLGDSKSPMNILGIVSYVCIFILGLFLARLFVEWFQRIIAALKSFDSQVNVFKDCGHVTAILRLLFAKNNGIVNSPSGMEDLVTVTYLRGIVLYVTCFVFLSAAWVVSQLILAPRDHNSTSGGDIIAHVIILTALCLTLSLCGKYLHQSTVFSINFSRAHDQDSGDDKSPNTSEDGDNSPIAENGAPNDTLGYNAKTSAFRVKKRAKHVTIVEEKGSNSLDVEKGSEFPQSGEDDLERSSCPRDQNIKKISLRRLIKSGHLGLNYVGWDESRSIDYRLFQNNSFESQSESPSEPMQMAFELVQHQSSNDLMSSRDNPFKNVPDNSVGRRFASVPVFAPPKIENKLPFNDTLAV